MDSVPPVEIRNRAIILDGAVWNILDNFARGDFLNTEWDEEKACLLIESSGSYSGHPLECVISLRRLNGDAGYKVVAKSASFIAIARLLELFQSLFNTNTHYHLFSGSELPFGMRIKGRFQMHSGGEEVC